MRLVGILHWLSIIPMWVLVIAFYFATLGVIWFLRDHYEGTLYNPATSSMLGDGLLAGVLLIGVTILQDGYNPPWFLNNGPIQFGMAVIAIGIGVMWFFSDHTSPKPADIYHHLVIAPMFIYLIGEISVPIIIYTGTGAQRVFLLAAVVCWAGSIWYDVHTGRYQPRTWLPAHGVILPK